MSLENMKEIFQGHVHIFDDDDEICIYITLRAHFIAHFDTLPVGNFAAYPVHKVDWQTYGHQSRSKRCHSNF